MGLPSVRAIDAPSLVVLHLLDVGGKALTLSGAEDVLFWRLAAGSARLQQTTHSEHVQAALRLGKELCEISVRGVMSGWG